jgi:polysaccharide biosynthesis transport protein
MTAEHKSLTSFGVDLPEILRSARKMWLPAATAVLLLTAMAAYGTSRMPRVYSARAQLLMQQSFPQVLDEGIGLDESAERVLRRRDFLNTQLEIMTSRPVLLDAIDRAKLVEDSSFLQDHGLSRDMSSSKLAKYLGTRIEVQPSKATQIVDVKVRDYEPARAARIANAVGQAYIDYTLEQRLEGAREASRWLDQRVAELSDSLEVREKQLQEFREKNLLVSLSLEDRQNMSSARLSLLNERLMEARGRLIERKAFRRALADTSIEQLPAVEIGAAGMRNGIVSELRAKLIDLEHQRAQLAIRYKPRHPEMQAIDRQLQAVQATLDQERRIFFQSVDKEIESLEATIDDLAAAMEEEKRQALAINSVGLEFSQLSRDVGNTRDIHQSLLRRQSEADLSGLLEANFVRWFQPAEPKLAPVSPSMVQNTALGALAGLMLAVLLVILNALLDNSIHDREDVERMGFTFLGVYPRILTPSLPKNRIQDEKTPERDLFVLQNPGSEAAECVRSIRTNLIFMGSSRPLKRILISSPRPGEGKTTTTIAMGVAMAQAGNRVLLVDSDLRRPSLHRAFGISRNVGLTNVLVGGSLDDGIKSSDTPGLDILPCGPIPPNPAELLHSARFAETLEALSERYDRILLDSPPLAYVVDGAILSKLVDGTLLVVLADDTPRDSLKRAVSRLVDVDATILGVVLNDFESNTKGYGYGSYYGYGSSRTPELAEDNPAS